MQPIPQALKKVADIIQCFSPDHMKELGSKNAQIASTRSFRFDIPDGKAKDGINRVKVTNMGDGSFRVQLLRIEEVDVIGGVPPEKLRIVLKAFTGLDF